MAWIYDLPVPWYQTLSLVVATIIALIGWPAALHQSYSLRLRREHQVKRLLDLTDKLPPGSPGVGHLETALRDATLDLAYVLEFPRTLKDRARPVIVGMLALFTAVFGGYLVGKGVSSWLLGAVYVVNYLAGYVFANTYFNLRDSDRLTKELFVWLNAPRGLVRTQPSTWRRVRQPVLGDVLEYSALVRDRITERPVSSVEAVNLGAEMARVKLNTLYAELSRLKVKARALRVATPLVVGMGLAVTAPLYPMVRARIRQVERRDPVRGALLRESYERTLVPQREELKRGWKELVPGSGGARDAA